MCFKSTVITCFIIFLSYQSSAQRNYNGYNFLGLTGGMSIFDIQTDDFVTNSRESFMGGFTSRGAFYNDFDLVYGISFQGAKIAVQGSSPLESNPQDIEYTINGAQINFLGSYNIVVKHLSVEFGPILQINGKMKLKDKKFEDYIMTGYTTTTAKDIQDISKIDFRVMGGITAGLEHFRLNAQYQYGVSNTFGKLNDKNLEKNGFKGNSSTILLAAIIYF